MTYTAELWRCEHWPTYFGNTASEPCHWSTYVEPGDKPTDCPNHAGKMRPVGEFELVGEA